MHVVCGCAASRARRANLQLKSQSITKFQFPIINLFKFRKWSKY